MKLVSECCVLITLVFCIHFAEVLGDKPCAPLYDRHGSISCICNSTYCDEISEVKKLPVGSYVIYSSSQRGIRFKKKTGSMVVTEIKDWSRRRIDWISDFVDMFHLSSHPESVILSLERSRTYQTIVGFGGGFTDSAAVNFKKLSKVMRKKLVMSLFSNKGIEFNMGRVSIGGSDFSERAYALNEYPENDLSQFNLSREDYDYKIPFIRSAMEVAARDIYLIGTSWSPPKWMKTNRELTGASRLLPEHYQTFADYFIKFLEKYEESGVPFWGLSTGNEPFNGLIAVTRFNSLGWWPPDQAKWIAENLGPTLRNSPKYSHLKILALDDQRLNALFWLHLMSSNKKAIKYIDGIAFHWYTNFVVSPVMIDIVHNMFPDKFLIGTEACVGVWDIFHEYVKYGAWDRAEIYIKFLMEDLNHGFVGWLDWNLVLDDHGGPNWDGNFVDSGIIVPTGKDIFIKQPYYYVFGHFSKFVPRGSIRINVEQLTGSVIENVAFQRPDGGIVLIFYNRLPYHRKVVVAEKGKGHINLKVPAQSIHTVIYW